MRYLRQIMTWGFVAMAVLVLGFMTVAAVAFLSARAPTVSVAPHNTYAETLVVAADFDFEPYSFRDENGDLAGHDIELVALLANALKANVEIRLMPWKAARDAVMTGEAHMLMGLDLRVEDRAVFFHSMPIVDDPFVAFGRKPFTRMRELYGEKLTTLDSGGGYEQFILPHRLEANTTTYARYYSALRAVVGGEHNYAIVRYSVGRRTLTRLENGFWAKIWGSGVRAVGPRLINGSMHIGVSKTNEDLVHRLDAAILELRRDGTLDRLQDKWLGEYVEVISMGDFLKAHLTEILCILGILASASLLIYIRVNGLLLHAVETQRDHFAKSLEYQQLITEAATDVYERIHEVDITHNVAASPSLEHYLVHLGLAADTPYDVYLCHLCANHVHPEHAAGLREAFSRERLLAEFKSGTRALWYEFLISMNDQGYVWKRVSARMFWWKADTAVRMITCWQNIDEEKRREHCLREESQRDAMTGLYNKKATRQHIEEHLEKPLREGYIHALFMLDIDHFKSVNDSLGHDFGDHVIMNFAGTLRRLCRESDVVGRVGGDEFVIFIPCAKDGTWIEKHAQLLVESLHAQHGIGDRQCVTTASVGVALSPAAGECFESLYKNADTALYATKARGRNGYTVFGV